MYKRRDYQLLHANDKDDASSSSSGSDADVRDSDEEKVWSGKRKCYAESYGGNVNVLEMHTCTHIHGWLCEGHKRFSSGMMTTVRSDCCLVVKRRHRLFAYLPFCG